MDLRCGQHPRCYSIPTNTYEVLSIASQLLIWGGILLASIAVLVKASDYFTDAAEQIGKYFRLPAFIIGVTIVAIGTSLPELVSSIFAVLRGASEIVVGNVVGSNIANIFLVLGITAIVGRKLKIAHELIHVDLPLLVGSTFLFYVNDMGWCFYNRLGSS